MNSPTADGKDSRRSANAGAQRDRLVALTAVILLVMISGCMNPQFTRFPTWSTSFPSAENAAFERQDPFPEPNFGPSTDSTPRGYDRPRSLPRQAAEQRLLQGVPVGPESVPAGVPRGGFNTSKVVR